MRFNAFAIFCDLLRANRFAYVRFRFNFYKRQRRRDRRKLGVDLALTATIKWTIGKDTPRLI